MAAADLLPSEVAGEPLASGSIVTETLYTVCTSTLVAEVPEDSSGVPVEYTRAQYNGGIVIHAFKLIRDDAGPWQSWGVLRALLWDDDWYGGASSFPKASYEADLDNRFTARKGGRSVFFFSSGVWVFGVDAENYLARNRFARDLIQHLNAPAPLGMVMVAERGYIVPIIVLIAVIMGTSIIWGRLLGKVVEDISGKVKASVSLNSHRRRS